MRSCSFQAPPTNERKTSQPSTLIPIQLNNLHPNTCPSHRTHPLPLPPSPISLTNNAAHPNPHHPPPPPLQHPLPHALHRLRNLGLPLGNKSIILSLRAAVRIPPHRHRAILRQRSRSWACNRGKRGEAVGSVHYYEDTYTPGQR